MTIVEDAARARQIVAGMSLEEKCGQLRQYFRFSETARQLERLAGEAAKGDAALASGHTGSLLFVSSAQETNKLQREHLAASRTQVPLLFGFDVIHGFRTIFPVPIGLAASFDPELVEECQRIAAREARAVGIRWTFAPMVDVCRDPRWGRMVEGAGEDPHLGSVMAAAQVRGFQAGGVIAGPKHLAGYGYSIGGRDYDEVDLSDHELYNVVLPPFAAAIIAGAGNVMTAYMPLNGIPATANKRLLTTILRDELGFGGFVVSDANAAINLVTQHLCADPVQAAARALGAGLDLEMSTGTAAFDALPNAVESKLVEEAMVTRAAERVLEAKIRAGLMEQPFVDEDAAEVLLADPAHRALARTAAARSAVLLKNEGGLLPIGPQTRRIAVLGPLAFSRRDTLGPWVFVADLEETVTLADGIRQGAPDDMIVDAAPGLPLPQRPFPWPFGLFHPSAPEIELDDMEAERARALDLACNADLAIVVLGERHDMSGEIASRATLDLAAAQLEFLQAVVATGTPVALLVMSGRPLDLRWAANHVPAILQIWHGGTQAGAGISDLLFGRAAPGARLPFTWPRHVGQVPLTYRHLTSHMPESQLIRYWEGEPSTPLFPFGYGLTYGEVRYESLTNEVGAGLPAPRVDCAVTLSNCGVHAAEEVVQLYIHQRSGRSARPVRELKAFRRVTLAPGETHTLTLSLTGEELRSWSEQDRAWGIDAGTFDIWVGASSEATMHGEFTLV